MNTHIHTRKLKAKKYKKLIKTVLNLKNDTRRPSCYINDTIIIKQMLQKCRCVKKNFKNTVYSQHYEIKLVQRGFICDESVAKHTKQLTNHVKWMSLWLLLNAEAILRATGATRDEEVTAKTNSVPHSSNVSTARRLAAVSQELGILGLPPEKMALVREKKDDIEKVGHNCDGRSIALIHTLFYHLNVLINIK